MAVDLIGLVSQYVTPQMIGQAAGAAGLDPTTAEELVGGAIPAVVAALASAAATPGGAQKIADAVSNADPDLLTKLSSAAGAAQNQIASDGAGKASALIGGGALSSLAAALSTHSGADQSIARLTIGAVAQALIRRARPAGSIDLVGRRGDRRSFRQPKERNRRRFAARPRQIAWRLRPVAGARRGGRRGGFERSRRCG